MSFFLSMTPPTDLDRRLLRRAEARLRLRRDRLQRDLAWAARVGEDLPGDRRGPRP